MMQFLTLTLLLGANAWIAAAQSISCKDPKGNPVDWFVIQKLPKISNHTNVWIKQGLGFLYMDGTMTDWKLSDVGLNIIPGNAIAQTLNQVYDPTIRKNSYHVMYNDQKPNMDDDSYRAHSKGVQLFNEITGFWFIHSVPRFAAVDSYVYPETGTKFGQSMICITFSTKKALAEIAEQLYMNQPAIYSSNLPANMAQQYPRLADVLAGKNQAAEPFSRKTVLESLSGKQFTSFAKHRKWSTGMNAEGKSLSDLYAHLVAPTLKAKLYVETWLNGAGDLLSLCTSTFSVRSLREVQPFGIKYSSASDHSKWAVSEVSTSPWICIGDINRQQSQDDRGGGTMCFQHPAVWSVYRKACSMVEKCENDDDVPA